MARGKTTECLHEVRHDLKPGLRFCVIGINSGYHQPAIFFLSLACCKNYFTALLNQARSFQIQCRNSFSKFTPLFDLSGFLLYVYDLIFFPLYY